MPTVTRTLTAKLVSPTVHKERKLRHLLTTYREALQDAFDSSANTMGQVNEIVTPYDLPYQAKDALKRYVPQLLSVREAHGLRDNHPLRLVNRAARFDYSADREFGYCWEVPYPGYGTNFWIPLQINPEQDEQWRDLVTGDIAAGELRVLNRRGEWYVHVSISQPVIHPNDSSETDITPIGIDVGESTLVTGCALDQNSPIRPLLCDGARARRIRKEMHTTLRRLQRRGASEWRVDSSLRHYRNALSDVIEKTSRQVISYAQEFDCPAIVMEDLSEIRTRIDGDAFMNRRLHGWAFHRIQGRIEDKALEVDIPVTYVSPKHTSQICHVCRRIGSRPHRGTFRCTTERCWVTTYQADLNAAVNIATRLDPWGESCQLNPDDDDSPRDGSPATGPRPLRVTECLD